MDAIPFYLELGDFYGHRTAFPSHSNGTLNSVQHKKQISCVALWFCSLLDPLPYNKTEQNVLISLFSFDLITIFIFRWLISVDIKQMDVKYSKLILFAIWIGKQYFYEIKFNKKNSLFELDPENSSKLFEALESVFT
jgi:hypothetical protein